MFKSKIERDYGDIIREIRHGKRREPRHKPASSVEADGITRLTQEHRDIWAAFARFGEVINVAQHHGPWSFEETPRVEFGWHGPDYGRQYHIFYNSAPAGTLQIGPVPLKGGLVATAELDLDFPQLIPESQVRDLLRTLWFMFAKLEDGDTMRAKADLEVTKIMTRHLWEVDRNPQSVRGLDVVSRALLSTSRSV